LEKEINDTKEQMKKIELEKKKMQQEKEQNDRKIKQ